MSDRKFSQSFYVNLKIKRPLITLKLTMQVFHIYIVSFKVIDSILIMLFTLKTDL